MSATHCALCGHPLPPRRRWWQRIEDFFFERPPMCKDLQACSRRFNKHLGFG